MNKALIGQLIYYFFLGYVIITNPTQSGELHTHLSKIELFSIFIIIVVAFYVWLCWDLTKLRSVMVILGLSPSFTVCCGLSRSFTVSHGQWGSVLVILSLFQITIEWLSTLKPMDGVGWIGRLSRSLRLLRAPSSVNKWLGDGIASNKYFPLIPK